MPKFIGKIDSLIEGIRKGSKSEVKGILEKGFVPPEGLFVVRGYLKFESTVSPFENYLDKVNIETKNCTMLEIVCTLGNLTLFDYLTKTLRLRHARDFRSDQGQIQFVSQQYFVYLPLLRRDEKFVTELLELTNLWTLGQLEDMALICRQLKWSKGINAVLSSKSCKRQYLTMPHTSQNLFLRYIMKLPFEITDTEVKGVDGAGNSNQGGTFDATDCGSTIDTPCAITTRDGQTFKFTVRDLEAAN